MRPVALFGSIAAAMVLWLSTRMFLGDQLWVWKVSCLLGAWAPIGAAALILYVREVGDREDGWFMAWCVRAVGMHLTLVWMLGMSDWLRGPPHTPPQWNSDVGMPLVFLAFAPVLALSVAALQWTRSVAARVSAYAQARQAGTLHLVVAAPSPYRDADTELRRAVPPSAPPSFAPVFAGAAGLVAPPPSPAKSGSARRPLPSTPLTPSIRRAPPWPRGGRARSPPPSAPRSAPPRGASARGEPPGWCATRGLAR